MGEEERWEENYAAMKRFLEEYKRFPKGNETFQGYNLGRWCNMQRRRFKKNTCTKEQIQKLESIGFVFSDVKEHQWNGNYELLKQFHDEYQRFPLSEEEYHGAKLGTWCRRQKSQEKKGLLPPEHKEKLVQLDFPFFDIEKMILIQYPTEHVAQTKINDQENWEDIFAVLEWFVKEYDRFPTPKEVWNGVRLYEWCFYQKAKEQNGLLSPEQKQKLVDIGFSFDEDESSAMVLDEKTERLKEMALSVRRRS